MNEIAYICPNDKGSRKFSNNPRISATCARSLSNKSFKTTVRLALICSGVRTVSANGNGAVNRHKTQDTTITFTENGRDL